MKPIDGDGHTMADTAGYRTRQPTQGLSNEPNGKILQPITRERSLTVSNRWYAVNGLDVGGGEGLPVVALLYAWRVDGNRNNRSKSTAPLKPKEGLN
jgi:hypothetical protein